MPAPSNAELLEQALATIPSAHRDPPDVGEPIGVGFAAEELRFQDYAFCQGFVFACFSRDPRPKRSGRAEWRCFRHGEKTTNTRHLTEAEREEKGRHNRDIQKLGCKARLVVTDDKGGGRILSFVDLTHNHESNPDPLQFAAHRSRQPGIAAATTLHLSHIGHMGYLKSAEIVKKAGYKPLESQEYWNLDKDVKKKRELTSQEEYAQIEQRLTAAEGWHCRVRAPHVVDEAGNQERRVFQDLFFCSEDEVRLARRYVSDFCYITDATFRTNKRRLPLAIYTGVTSTGDTFPFAYCYIVAESAESFKWQQDRLTELFFYDRAQPRVIIGDFAAGLAAANPQFMAEEIPEVQNPLPLDGADSDEEGNALEEAELQAAARPSASRAAAAREREEEARQRQIVLQLCEWHAVQAIRRRLVQRGYKKEQREVIDDLLWTWVQSPNVEALQRNRTELLKNLRTDDQAYVRQTYQRKEYQFVRAYTKNLPNLGCHSTQRGEKNHHVTKEKGLNRHLRLIDAVSIIITQDADLGDRIRRKQDHERDRVPRGIVLTGKAFQDIRSAITNYALTKILPEWAEAKARAAAVTAAPEEEEGEIGCSFHCENPQRYGLPCRHWLFKAAVTGRPIPQSLIHPRWFYDEPAVPRGTWCMTYVSGTAGPAATAGLASNSMIAIKEDDLYREHGAPMLESTLLGAQELHRSLTGWEAEEFASAARRVIEQVVQLQEERRSRRSALPIEAPRNPAPTWERGGGKKRERAVTGVDLAEQQERENSRQRHRQQREARLEAEPEQDQEVNFLNIDDFIEEVDMSQPNPAPNSTRYATPERPEYSQITRYATPDAPEYSQLTRFATPEAPEYSQLTRYATPEAPEYSQLTQPLQLGSPSHPPSMSSHASAMFPRSYGRAGPLPIGELLAAAAAREGVVREAATAREGGVVPGAATAREEGTELSRLLAAATAREERVVHKAATATAAATKPKQTRKAKAKAPQTEEQQQLAALKAEAKAANEEARAKKAAVKAATAAATAARKEVQRTAKELAAKKKKNEKESQPLAEQTQQPDFELPFRSSQ
ncbi:MAG: hypothetical protein M1812_003734 [Candelaria pacifica]|nr:MAG: hypothetical protein M1812_003734 [Candelaria pacifica]